MSDSNPPATLGIRHVALKVADVERSERFYVGVTEVGEGFHFNFSFLVFHALFDGLNQLSQKNRPPNTRHVFQGDLIGTEFDRLIHHMHVMFNGMDR